METFIHVVLLPCALLVGIVVGGVFIANHVSADCLQSLSTCTIK